MLLEVLLGAHEQEHDLRQGHGQRGARQRDMARRTCMISASTLHSAKRNTKAEGSNCRITSSRIIASDKSSSAWMPAANACGQGQRASRERRGGERTSAVTTTRKAFQACRR